MINEEKLVCVIMGQNCEQFISMALEAVKNSDKIIYCDGGSIDNTLSLVRDFEDVKIIENKYNQDDIGMNGKQRNFYLDYVKKNYPDYWCLAIDADEIVEDIEEIKKFINRMPQGIYSIKMRHLINDLASEDATVEEHYVLNRLFKIDCAELYPEVEHPVLQGKEGAQIAGTKCTTIWHLAYIPNMWDIKRRYDNHLKKSNMHTPEYLRQWYYAHLFGTYPKKRFDPAELPRILLDNFGIEKDELYFVNRGIEAKHSLMVKQWNEYFLPSSVLDIGCGRGPYLFYWDWVVNDIKGIELSQWAIDHALIKDKIIQGDITKDNIQEDYDLITCIDVLEHLDEIGLNKALDNISKRGQNFLFSIPFIGDQNLYKDPTHKIFEEKQWWIDKIKSYGLEHLETPEDWLFKDQMLIFKKSEKKDE